MDQAQEGRSVRPANKHGPDQVWFAETAYRTKSGTVVCRAIGTGLSDRLAMARYVDGLRSTDCMPDRSVVNFNISALVT
ncbi:hypothetical protein Q3G72_005666 [Acer saccharum]|nr:hypothetical protein Q3G72_005666 [Acer saccharum]